MDEDALYAFPWKLRREVCQDYGNRSRNDWGEGDLPAPFCSGDVVKLVGEPHERLRGQVGPYFLVTYAPSVDEGDAWYFRVWDGNDERGSDRLHVACAERSTWDEDVDWMAPFVLVETVDPDGLAERERLLAAGWTCDTVVCPTCGQHTDRASLSGGSSGPGVEA